MASPQRVPDPDNDDLDDLDPEEADRIGRLVDRYISDREKKAKRNQEPKTWAEALDKISDAVVEKLRGEGAREPDEPPSSGGSGGGKTGGFLDWFNGTKR